MELPVREVPPSSKRGCLWSQSREMSVRREQAEERCGASLPRLQSAEGAAAATQAASASAARLLRWRTSCWAQAAAAGVFRVRLEMRSGDLTRRDCVEREKEDRASCET
jgi:hypothetical protein